MTVLDTPRHRKARGAFFTPPALAEFIASWSIRAEADRVLEPSCGDAVFLRAAADRLSTFRHPSEEQLVGWDVHQESLRAAKEGLDRAGYSALLREGDFFESTPARQFDAVIGNPPFIRFQGFTGASRAAALRESLSVGVNLSGLASSWAGFVVHASSFLIPGGRLGLVLPAELLSVNYAAPVRQFLLRSFRSIELVLFDELVFPDAQAEVVVLLADGYGEHPSDHFNLFQTRNIESISSRAGFAWTPSTPAAKWTDALLGSDATAILRASEMSGAFSPLSDWGRLTSGTVTGANEFFSMTPATAAELGLEERDLVRVLPPGHPFTALESIDAKTWPRIEREGRSLLFSPRLPLSTSALAYIATGVEAKLHERYKCRIRTPWWKVPEHPPADLFVSYMSGSTPRLVANRLGVRHLNSVHGLVTDSDSDVGKKVLPLLSLNSLSLLSAELVGRTYGGGILKLEPREADRWLIPSKRLVREIAQNHGDLLGRGRRTLRAGDMDAASLIADELVTVASERMAFDPPEWGPVRAGRAALVRRRVMRGRTAAADPSPLDPTPSR